MSKYNGWTNRETWLVNIWFMAGIESKVTPDYLQDMVEEHVDYCLKGSPGFIWDMINLSVINWEELADNHNSDREE